MHSLSSINKLGENSTYIIQSSRVYEDVNKNYIELLHTNDLPGYYPYIGKLSLIYTPRAKTLQQLEKLEKTEDLKGFVVSSLHFSFW
jgi:hypothetical protein